MFYAYMLNNVCMDCYFPVIMTVLQANVHSYVDICLWYFVNANSFILECPTNFMTTIFIQL